ncbi:MAG: hypothetical protein HN344_06870 [Gammaproteobacteria bacterium]|nr:hypothetical protein [Gammaproteobacteria bacterium]
MNLIYNDELNDVASVVIPMSFTLRRNKQRPLLHQYQISLLEVNPVSVNEYEGSQSDPYQAEPDGVFTPSSSRFGGGFQYASYTRSRRVRNNSVSRRQESLGASVDILQNEQSERSFSLLEPDYPGITEFTRTSRTHFQETLDSGVANDSFSSLSERQETHLSNSRNISRAGMDIYHAIDRDRGTHVDLGGLGDVISAFRNIYCLLSNLHILFNLDWFNASIYLGASNCSSTSWGGALSQFIGSNPFLQTLTSDRSNGRFNPSDFDLIDAAPNRSDITNYIDNSITIINSSRAAP